ncbi:MAG: imidazole glycerol phosphate synthase subunit HisH [Anaerolineae bacterium]|nr:imidazole glycerol phosphate synthase subunit HisH [Thermoflexales bacterium]MDW8396814.1 imidazole glycerol phosphate synthase subunit HisH [Anaerolineae bacterium]
MIALVDYGAGNLRNVQKALEHVGARVTLTDEPEQLAAADKIVLPGVGAFADCRRGLIERGLFEPLRALAQAGKPLLGICVGMQLLFEVGEEMGEWEGLGLIPGRVVRFAGAPFEGANALKVPHIGWNQLHPVRADHPLLRNIRADSYAYFVHSYHACVFSSTCVVATTDYGYEFPSIVAKDNIWGLQFHPEKSQDTGLQLLKNFVELG